jgi:hypothetical protein
MARTTKRVVRKPASKSPKLRKKLAKARVKAHTAKKK